MRTLTLYHGNTESAIDEMVINGALLPKYESIGDKHYLGDGFYFYDDPYQAKVWAIMKVSRNRKYIGQKWAVMKCVIRVAEDQILDLDNREEQEFFFKEMVQLQKELNHNALEVENYTDAYLCNHIANVLELGVLTKTFVYMDKHQAFPPLFSNDRSGPYAITRHFRTEKQYVVRGTFSSVIVQNLTKSLSFDMMRRAAR